MNDESKPYQGLGKLIGDTIARKRLEDERWTQGMVAEKCDISAAELSRLCSGKRCLGASRLVRLARELGLDLGEVLLLKSIGDNSEDDPARVSEANAIRETLSQLLDRTRAEQQRSETAPDEGPLTLVDWRRRLNIRTVLVGDRRELPPKTAADVLALTASTGDVTFLGDLGLRSSFRIRIDKILKLASPHNLESLLSGDCLVLGSPSANFGARVINGRSTFRFHVEDDLRDDERRFEKDLQPICFDVDALEEYTREFPDRKNERMRQLRNMLRRFAKPGFIDPIKFVQPRGLAPRADCDYGMIALARSPWSKNGLVIFAAGRAGPGTAAAVRLLATDDFHDHPLGGVFKVNISSEAPWELRYEQLRPKWETYNYTLDDFDKELESMPSKRGLTKEEVTELRHLLTFLKERR
jgi:plasmid maintenance system antidote protein VapI